MSRECFMVNKKDHQSFSAELNRLGRLSAEAQNLGHPITSWEKLATDTVILLLEDKLPTGFLRWGYRDLYLTPDPITTPLKLHKRVLCVLDFFVEHQRQGRGTFLMDSLVKENRITSIAFDRPSTKLVPFLKSKYSLTDLIAQPNKFVISRQFFYT